jgi:hypothetical protein
VCIMCAMRQCWNELDVDDKRWCLNVVQCLVYGDAKFHDVVGAVLLLVIVCDDAMI